MRAPCAPCRQLDVAPSHARCAPRRLRTDIQRYANEQWRACAEKDLNTQAIQQKLDRFAAQLTQCAAMRML